MVEPGAGGIFVSYRRSETGHVAGRLADRLRERFGPSKVFIDVESIQPGVDFVRAIEEAVGRSDVVLALIGRQWLTISDEDGRRRLDDPHDYVVHEIQAALARDVRLIPVLVDGSEMPAREDLPAALEPMVSRNAIRLNLETFRRDVRSLVEALEELVPGVGPTAAGEPPKALLWSHTMTRRRLLRAALGAAALGATGLGLWSLSRLDRGGPLWVFATGDEVYSSPAVVDGVVYIGSTDQHLYAIDAATGAERWRYRADGAVTSSPAVVDGAVYVGCNDARLHVVDAGTGVRRWTFSTGAVIHSSPAVDQGIVFVGSRDQNVYAIDAQTGQQRWRFTGGDWFNSSPTVAGDAVYIGCRDHNIYALDAATGAKRWGIQQRARSTPRPRYREKLSGSAVTTMTCSHLTPRPENGSGISMRKAGSSPRHWWSARFCTSAATTATCTR